MVRWTATLLQTSWKVTQDLTLATYAGKFLECCSEDNIVVLCVMALCSLLGGYQWHIQEFYLGGSTNSIEDRGQR
jgi:hypothetical protein